MTVRLIIGDCLDVLPTLPEKSVQCVVTSPPYWGLRDYGTAKWEGGDAACGHVEKTARNDVTPERLAERAAEYGTGQGTGSHVSAMQFRGSCRDCGATRIDSQLGLEKTPDEYVAKMVAVFREVKRVLRDDGTLWLNLGDSYGGDRTTGRNDAVRQGKPTGGGFEAGARTRTGSALRSKDLCGIPWRVAFALQADGWYLRSDIIWAKPNPMPESVTDRPTKAHEYLFLLTKSASYFYDADAIAEPAQPGTHVTTEKSFGGQAAGRGITPTGNQRPGVEWQWGATRNRRSVWTVATRPYKGAHFATFPPKLIEPCILAGTSPQACEHCAAPWERVTSRGDVTAPTFAPLAITEAGALPDGGVGTHRNMGGRYQAWLDANPKQTTGWQPTCACADNTGAGRCVVLDPFGGAGTTGLVTDRLGRDAILIELSEDHIDQSLGRITDDAPLFANVHVGNGNGNGHA